MPDEEKEKIGPKPAAGNKSILTAPPQPPIHTHQGHPSNAAKPHVPPHHQQQQQHHHHQQPPQHHNMPQNPPVMMMQMRPPPMMRK